MPVKKKRAAVKKLSKKPVRGAAAKKQTTVAESPAVYAAPKQQISIAAAKGRPMLTWVGKRPLRQISVFPAQQAEVFDPIGEAGKRESGLLFHGDNKEVLAHLLANGYRGKVNLVYIDPPFDSGADYVRKVQLRGVGGAAKLDGESYTLGEQIQYTDIWANDNYLQFMYERLLMLKELLADNGNLYLHSDPSKNHQLRCLMDEVFGVASFRNEIVWQRQTAHSDSKTFGFVHDTIYWYSKSPTDLLFEKQYIPYSEEYLKSHYSMQDENGRPFTLRDLNPPHGQGPVYDFRGFVRPWRFTEANMKKLDTEGRIYQTPGMMPRLKVYLEDTQGMPIQDIWIDLNPINSQAKESEDYPTQKPEVLLSRIISSSSRIGDIVLDCFIGSGTTAAVAQKLGRRWIACDINKGAIQTTSKRLQSIITEQVKQEAERKAKPRLMETEAKDEIPRPAQLSFAVYRVNDYDLQIQHNEAVNLACERIGITRTKGDGFFDGTLGKKLVKIIPFNHPLSPLDLEEVKRELSARPDEERDIVVVCLGKEFATDAWLEEWNRLRKKGDVPNKFEVIELRTDPKYGQFFVHQPASARVQIKRADGELHVEIKDFISPSIVERLKQQAGVLTPQITDWRAMVDTVMIDTAYDGKVFNIALSDVPEKKSDLVEGKYTLPAPTGKTNVAVKIVDMLGEEVLVVEENV